MPTVTAFIKTASENPAWTINRDGSGTITSIDALVEGVTYRATVTYTAGALATVSAYVVQ